MMVLMFLALILSIASLGLDSTYKELTNSMHCIYAGESPPDPERVAPKPWDGPSANEIEYEWYHTFW